MQRALVDAVLALDEPYRSAVLLRYFEGLEPAEIARRRGVPAGTVRSHLSRGLAELRAALDRRHGGDTRTWCAALLPLAIESPGAPAGTLLATSLTLGGLTMNLSTPLLLGAAVLAAVLTFSVLRDDPAAPAPLATAAAPRSSSPSRAQLRSRPSRPRRTESAARRPRRLQRWTSRRCDPCCAVG